MAMIFGTHISKTKISPGFCFYENFNFLGQNVAKGPKMAQNGGIDCLHSVRNNRQYACDFSTLVKNKNDQKACPHSI